MHTAHVMGMQFMPIASKIGTIERWKKQKHNVDNTDKNHLIFHNVIFVNDSGFECVVSFAGCPGMLTHLKQSTDCECSES